MHSPCLGLDGLTSSREVRQPFAVVLQCGECRRLLLNCATKVPQNALKLALCYVFPSSSGFELAFEVERIRSKPKFKVDLIRLVSLQMCLQLFGAGAKAEHEHSLSELVQRPSMADLQLVLQSGCLSL
eukprot:TRINITY_DN7790_c0_g1_i3.p1 TRINITY_DN7790_c0_g1~~TRINITY_DN7790_c0_g1_i3.p1  ORF type:complete len:128 (-),score=7.83 TRINITY_DN7790_c0_g1_i3:158-541(-)